MIDYDAELHLHNQVLRRAYGIGRHDEVLDIGCGTGQTTRDAARMACEGSVLGVDVSEAMIERAREFTRAAGVGNAEYQRGDAQTHPFPHARFDVAISRFGTMFFTDPVAAFANIGRALRPAGRLVMMVWQAHARNEWAVSIRSSILGEEAPQAEAPATAAAFSLGDPAATARILGAAGFADAAFAEVRQPVHYGPDVSAALDFVQGFSTVQRMLAPLDPASAQRSLDRLREILAAHGGQDGVWFDSRAWIVTARLG